MSRETASVNSSRTHTERPILMASHLKPRRHSPTGSARSRSTARASSTAVMTVLLSATQASTTRADSAARRPLPEEHGMQPPAAALDHAPQERHPALGQRQLEDRARQPVDLHDEQTSPSGR